MPPARPLLPWLTGAGFIILAVALFWVWRHPAVEIPPAEPVAQLAQQISALEARVSRLEQRPQPAPADLAPLTARVAALEQRPMPDLGPLAARVAALEQRPQPSMAPPPPAPDLAPLNARVTALEQRPQPDTAKLEARVNTLEAKQAADDRTAGRIDALEAAQRASHDELTRRLGGDEKATAHLAQVQAAALALDAGRKLGDVPGAPAALARFANANPPTEAALRLSFPQVARDALAASHPTADGKPLLTRLWAQAQDLVTVRRGDQMVLGDPTAGVLEHAQTALDAGDLAAAVTALESLQGSAAEAVSGWLAQARALLEARAALAAWAAQT